MTTMVSAKSWGEVVSRAWRRRAVKRALLAAGIAAPVVYVVGDVLSGLMYQGYSFKGQAISELSAYGSPVRPLMVAFLIAHGLLLVAFSAGLWLAGDQSKALRGVAVFLLPAALVGLVLHPFFPMSSRGMEAGFNDTMHGTLTFVFVFFVLAAVICGAIAYQGWFRLYSIGSLVVLAVFGGLAGAAIPRIAGNLPTPWLGVFERANVYLAWLAVLAITVLRRSLTDATPAPTATRMRVQAR
jgi:hypothetical membrane protein